MWRFCATAV
ncbi:hypothetical protein LINPERHAP2_LOCUS37595 [Linum perenne]